MATGKRFADPAPPLLPIAKDKTNMKTRALMLASSLLVAATGAALADDLAPNDYNPTQMTRHTSQQINSPAPGSRDLNGPGRVGMGPVQEVQTYRLPRELQWMNRPQNLFTGGNR